MNHEITTGGGYYGNALVYCQDCQNTSKAGHLAVEFRGTTIDQLDTDLIDGLIGIAQSHLEKTGHEPRIIEFRRGIGESKTEVKQV